MRRTPLSLACTNHAPPPVAPTRRNGFSRQYGVLPPDLVSELQALRNRHIKIRRSNGELDDHWQFTDDVNEKTTEIHLTKTDDHGVYTKTLLVDKFGELVRLNLPTISKTGLPGTKPPIAKTGLPGTNMMPHVQVDAQSFFELYDNFNAISSSCRDDSDKHKLQQLRDEWEAADARSADHFWKLRAMYLLEQLWLAMWSANIGRLQEFWKQQKKDYQQLPQTFSLPDLLPRLIKMNETVSQQSTSSFNNWKDQYQRMQLWAAAWVSSRWYDFIPSRQMKALLVVIRDMNFRAVGEVPLGGWGRPYHELIKDPTWK
jgi:hypothetical protein